MIKLTVLPLILKELNIIKMLLEIWDFSLIIFRMNSRLLYLKCRTRLISWKLMVIGFILPLLKRCCVFLTWSHSVTFLEIKRLLHQILFSQLRFMEKKFILDKKIKQLKYSLHSTVNCWIKLKQAQMFHVSLH